jgi:hypothetical protein
MFAQAAFIALLPVIIEAAAFPWDLPQVTPGYDFIAGRSAATTAAPIAEPVHIFGRQATAAGNTCGYVSGISGARS